MKLGLSTAAFYSIGETEENAAHVASLPVDTCEVFLECWSEYTVAFGQLVRQQLGDLHVSSVHPKGTQFENDLFARSARQVQDAREIFTGVIQAGQAVGAKYYVMHGPGTVVTPRTPEQILGLAEHMGVLQGIAQAHGMEVLWENVSWCSMRTTEHLRTLKGILPDMHFVLDTKQAYRAGIDPRDMLAAMGQDLRHVHVLDWTAEGKLCLPGEGAFDWPDFFCRLKDMGYRGSVILEPYENLSRDDARLIRSLEYLRGLMG